MNNTQTPDAMSDIEYYNAALARFEAQPVGRAELCLRSTIDSLQRADIAKSGTQFVRSYWAEVNASLRDLLSFADASDIKEFAAWVEAEITIQTAANPAAMIGNAVKNEGTHARTQANA